MEINSLRFNRRKFALKKFFLVSVALSLATGGSTVLIWQNFAQILSFSGFQTQHQKSDVFARVVHDVDVIKNS